MAASLSFIKILQETSGFSRGRNEGWRQRGKLQQVGSRSAKRKLKKLAGKEQRFARDTNHRISKQLVIKAQRTKRALALEDLRGLRARVRVRRRQRTGLHSWAFGQLRQMVSYKAQPAGIPVVLVDPAYTSQTCPVCGPISKSNRKSQSEFLCVACSGAGLADHLAAVAPPHSAGLSAAGLLSSWIWTAPCWQGQQASTSRS